jgi:hypothetical protein
VLSTPPKNAVEVVYKVPPLPPCEPASKCKWIPPGEAIEIAGTMIPGGMIYVGLILTTGYRQQDPALINPNLPVKVRFLPRSPIFFHSLFFSFDALCIPRMQFAELMRMLFLLPLRNNSGYFNSKKTKGKTS